MEVMTAVKNRSASSSMGTSGLLDVNLLARRLGVTDRFIRRLVDERRVPFFKIGKFVRFDPEEIDEWIQGQRVRVPWAETSHGVSPKRQVTAIDDLPSTSMTLRRLPADLV
jgi:excisionase family DNA binding protein